MQPGPKALSEQAASVFRVEIMAKSPALKGHPIEHLPFKQATLLWNSTMRYLPT